MAEISNTTESIAADLLRLLHRNATAEEFTSRLAQAEALSNDDLRKPDFLELIQIAINIQNRLELQQQSEQGMLTVFESAKDLSSRLDLTSLQHAIVTRARNLMGAQMTWLTVYDADDDAFRVMVIDGGISIGTDRTLAGNLGIAGVVLSTCLPFSTPDYLHDTRFPHDMEVDNWFRDEGISALVGVPLLCEGKVLGLLFVADRYYRIHTALNIGILSTLATHAAVAINNAKAFEQANSAREKADLACAELERHVRNVQSAAEAHEQLTSLLAKGASLSTLCQTIAQLLKGDLLVIDEASQVISQASAPEYAGKALETYTPHGVHNTAITRALRESRSAGRSVVAYEQDGELCRVTTVIGGNDMLGAVLLFRHTDLSEVLIRTLERSSSLIGIVLLSQERIDASKSRDASSLLRTLIFSHHEDAGSIADRAERFGLDLSKPVSLVLIEMCQLRPDFAVRYLRKGVLFSKLVLDEVDGVLAIVCSATHAQEVLNEFTATAKSAFGQDYRGILSRPIHTIIEIPTLYATLKRALSVLGRLGVKGQIIKQNEMALYTVLFETLDRDSLQVFFNASIGPMTAHDKKRGSNLTYTLLSYFDNNQNAKSTAVQLGIHVNTLRQRLANIEELLGYWGNPRRALEIHVALRLWSLSIGHNSEQK